MKIIKISSIVFLFATTLYSNPADSLNWQNLSVPQIGTYTFIEDTINTVHNFQVADYDRDGKDEIGYLRHDGSFPSFWVVKEVMSLGYTYYGPNINIQTENQKSYINFFNNHPWYSFAAYRTDEQYGYFDFYDHHFQLAATCKTVRGIDITGDNIWNGGPQFANTSWVDLNNDQRKDFITMFRTNADATPRAIVGYDVLTQKELLHLEFAPLVHFLNITDLENDGESELLVSLSASEYGEKFGLFDRDSTYLAILNARGKVLNKWAFSGYKSYILSAVADFNQDHIKDIVFSVYNTMDIETRQSGLYLIDGKTKTLLDSIIIKNDGIF